MKKPMMKQQNISNPAFALALLLFSPFVAAEDDTVAGAEQVAATDESALPNGDGIASPKTMSGMSILGNEEAPKALVIVPWKSSELGEAISLTDTLDDRAKPVDKDVFLRELRFYEIRSAE